MTFDPLFKVLLVIFQLGTGRHSIRLEKMILGCKFHILGIKTTLGQHITKNSSCLWGISCEITLRWWNVLDRLDDKSTLVHVMAWCHQVELSQSPGIVESSLYRRMASLSHNELNQSNLVPPFLIYHLFHTVCSPDAVLRWVATNSFSAIASISAQSTWLYWYWWVAVAFHTPPCAVILLHSKASGNGTSWGLVAV